MSIKFIMGPTLCDAIDKWFADSGVDLLPPDKVIELAEMVENWIPKEQTYCGSQLPAFAEHEIDGYNQAIKEIKSKIRGKYDKRLSL